MCRFVVVRVCSLGPRSRPVFPERPGSARIISPLSCTVLSRQSVLVQIVCNLIALPAA